MEKLLQLRELLVGEELDYFFLINQLQDYAKPRDKITRYLKNGDLIRVKKGLYILGEVYRKGLVSLEVLANLIYGPSYLSLEYALSFYGLIPERVECLTSITTQKNKIFQTPLGFFSYQYLSLKKYREGLVQHTRDGKRFFIMASPEKALADILEQQQPLSHVDEVLEFFIHHLRIEASSLKKLNLRNLSRLVKIYQSPSLELLLKWIHSHA